MNTISKQFIKYVIIGISAVLLDLFSLYCLKEYLHFQPVWAVVANQLLMVNYTFFLNKRWSFADKEKAAKQILKFYALAASNYAFAILWMWFFTQALTLNYLAVRLANIILAVGWNFLLYKYWIFSEHTHGKQNLSVHNPADLQ